MAKFLVSGSYTAEGVKGLHKDKASGRVATVKQSITGLGA